MTAGPFDGVYAGKPRTRYWEVWLVTMQLVIYTNFAAIGDSCEARMLPVITAYSYQPMEDLLIKLEREDRDQHSQT